MKDILIIGCGGHAKVVYDVIEQAKNYNIVGFISEKKDNKFEYRGKKAIGTDEQLIELYKSGIQHAVVGIGYLGDSQVRDRVYTKLKKIGFEIPALVDITAKLAADVKIGEGAFIGKGAIINSNAIIDDMAIINSGAIVEHDCKVGQFSHVSIATNLCGSVVVGHHTFIGAGTTIIQCVAIGNNVVVGAGSTVLNDISSNSKVFGIVK
ncbi:MAG: acetyltransferase [Lachnospiraceae bacterium]|nr:acetyltransferase [Lachnospiraceae bacterium]